MKIFAFNMAEAAVLLDSGYMTPYICKELLGAGGFPMIAERKTATREGTLPKELFTYDATRECFVCPKGEVLPYSVTNRQSYQLFQSNASHCAQCPILDACTSNKNKKRAIQRHVWEWCKEKVMAVAQNFKTIAKQLARQASALFHFLTPVFTLSALLSCTDLFRKNVFIEQPTSNPSNNITLLSPTYF
jgi:hypothetical protein